MRDEMNKSLGIKPNMSHMHDNPLALATDEQPFSMMSAERKFPIGGYTYGGANYNQLSGIITKLFEDEVDAISAYERAIESVDKDFPDIAYIFGIIANEEYNHRRILQEIQLASILQTRTPERELIAESKGVGLVREASDNSIKRFKKAGKSFDELTSFIRTNPDWVESDISTAARRWHEIGDYTPGRWRDEIGD